MTSVEDEKKQHRERRRIIREHRQDIARATDQMGNDVLKARRELGIPDPDGEKFGLALVRYQLGLRALALAVRNENYRVEHTPSTLRELLTNPITETPATDEELRMCIDLLREREELLNEEEKQ